MNLPAVKGLCHLVAHELDSRIDGEIVGAYTSSGKVWHYGFRLPDGRVLCNEGGIHSSTAAFEWFANGRYEEISFEIQTAEVPEDTVEIFGPKTKKEVSVFVDTLIQKALS